MTEPYTIKMPQLSDTMTEGVVVSWEKAIGDPIKRGDIVATIETDKAVMDVEVFRDGYLSGPLAAVDRVVPVGEPLAYVVAEPQEAQGADDAAPATRPATPADPPAQPAAPEGRAPTGMTHVIKMPQLSDTMTEGVVVSWEKGIGEAIQRGDVVATVETDKAVMDVEVFRAGYLSGPMAPVDSTVAVGEPLAYLVEQAEQAVHSAAAPAAPVAEEDVLTSPSAQADRHRIATQHPVPGHRPVPIYTGGGGDDAPPAPRPQNKYATPLARKLAGQAHINLDGLTGHGPQGEITAADVQRARRVERPTHQERLPDPFELPEVQVPGEGRPMSTMERAVSHNMTAALTMPTFHVTTPADTTALIKAAKRLGISVTVAIAKACALAIKQHPTLNWAYQPVDKLVERDNVDIGMAVAADGGGLVVPVLRNCESRPLADLNTEWKALVGRARKRRLKPEEYSNSTFQISNLGMFGVSHFDAIPTPGIAAILALGAAGRDGMPMTVTADHRVVNGAEVALFLQTLQETLQHPSAWLGEPEAPIPAGDWDYDVVVIGGGPGGEDCARELVEHGLRVALVNDGPYPGGECLWRGCIPSKTWRAAADRMKDRAHDATLGIEGTDSARLNWPNLERHRRGILEERGQLALKTDKSVKIHFLQGFARFESDHRLFIDTSGNHDDPHHRAPLGDRSEGQRVSFGAAVIATGAPPFVPPIPGAREGIGRGVHTSDTIWDLPEPPRRLVVVGGGAIGVEMAQMFQDFGAEVTLIEVQDRILGEVESEVAKQLARILNEQPRLAVHTGAKVQSITGEPGTMQVEWTDSAGQTHTTATDLVAMATGKRPNLQPLDLDNAGVRVEDGHLAVDARGRTSTAHIYGVGDAIGGLMLAHTAGAQGRVAAQNLIGEEARYAQDKDCGVIFTRPQAGFVGLSVDQAKAQDLDVSEVKVPLSIDAKAMINGETEGLIKLVADKASHRIVGVHFLADHADTLIGEAVMMVSAGLTLEQVGNAIHPHPTQTELFGDLARRLLARLRRSAKRAKTSASS